MSDFSIVYLHGFGSSFDPSSDKVQALRARGTVDGPNIDYTQGLERIIAQALSFIGDATPDLVVGTSMGGWLSSQLSAELDIPFVACNPAIEPSESLRKYLGEGVDYQGEPFVLTEPSVASLPEFNLAGSGIVLLDMADEVIPASRTKEKLAGHFQVISWEGGNHRFTHMVEAVPLIREHCLEID